MGEPTIQFIPNTPQVGFAYGMYKNQNEDYWIVGSVKAEEKNDINNWNWYTSFGFVEDKDGIDFDGDNKLDYLYEGDSGLEFVDDYRENGILYVIYKNPDTGKTFLIKEFDPGDEYIFDSGTDGSAGDAVDSTIEGVANTLGGLFGK